MGHNLPSDSLKRNLLRLLQVGSTPQQHCFQNIKHTKPRSRETSLLRGFVCDAVLSDLIFQLRKVLLLQ